MIVFERNILGVAYNIRYENDNYILSLDPVEYSTGGDRISSDITIYNDPSKELEILKAQKIKDAEISKEQAFETEKVIITSNIDVLQPDGVTWLPTPNIEIEANWKAKTKLNKFSVALLKNDTIVKDNWPNNGNILRIDKDSCDLILDAIETKDDHITDWINNKKDAINDCEAVAELSLIETDYPN